MANSFEGSVIIAGLMAISNLGGLVYIGKRYIARVDKYDEIIPKLLESMEANTKSVIDLYEKYNRVSEAFYQLKGSHDSLTSGGSQVHHVHARETD